jgi:cytochrome o ubiquinol oxidase subunit 3
MSNSRKAAKKNDLTVSRSDKTLFGFWVYLMTDVVLFASLFATFMVLRNNTFGGPSSSELFSLPYVLVETMILLTSSFSAGLGLLAAYRGDRKHFLVLFGITFLLGLLFLGLELNEFNNLINEGHGWSASASLSAFFTLVGTHGAHITIGLIWMATAVKRVMSYGLQDWNVRQLTMLSLFWHFLDVIWIFIFTIVYLMGETGV